MFVRSPGVRIGGLLLSDNNLGEQLEKDENKAFDNYKELKVLDISINRIKNIAKYTFMNLTALGNFEFKYKFIEFVEI